jgi:hypothetical protein
VKNMRRLVKLGLLVLLGSLLGGCIVVPLHGWGGREHRYERDYGGNYYRH